MKDFRDGLTSLALMIVIFSFAFIFGTIFLQPYIGLKANDRNFILILCSINLFFCVYYLGEGKNLTKIFRLENKNIIKFGKRIGIITLIYAPHIFVFSSLFFRELHNLEILMAFLIFIMELLLIGLILKEAYDLVLSEETHRNFEIEENRKKYINNHNKPMSGLEL
ncbi:MAG: hypothetical protein ACW99E_00155 [Promethearchaeota archaeon]